ncbi:Cro protein [Corynebacterium phage TouchMeNot]|nr:Cro protein [Corynebacterium phage TouchMeNot]
MKHGGEMKYHRIRPGAIEELAAELGAKSSKDTALMLGITPEQLEELRYGDVTNATAIALANRAQQLRRAAEIIGDTAA